MQRIDGKKIAAQIRAEVAEEIRNSSIKPGLGVLLVGDDPASHIYVNLKEKAAKEAGISTTILRIPAETSDEELERIIKTWNADSTIDAILVQLPLPAGHDTERVIAAIDPSKDVDGFHSQNMKALLEGSATLFPPVHESILRLIGATDLRLHGSRAVILANSNTFAEPLQHLLTAAGSSVTIMLSATNIDAPTLEEADLIVIAFGRARFLKRSMIKPGVCVIDVGTNRVNGNMMGDVDAESMKDLSGWLSPVPGGVGPVTVALLLKNTLELAKRHHPIVPSPNTR